MVQRLRVRYAKRGRLRFTSHRDFARAFERAIRRSGIPIAFSAGFSPHPKISYVGAAPTGTASEAEYLEIGLAEERDPDVVHGELDSALPPGLDILQITDAAASAAKSLAELVEASVWCLELSGVSEVDAQSALAALLATTTAPVQRPTKDGTRTVDVRIGILSAAVAPRTPNDPNVNSRCATLEVVVQHLTPAVRPDDIWTALRSIGALSTLVTPKVTRLAQGLIDHTSPHDARRLIDPLG